MAEAEITVVIGGAGGWSEPTRGRRDVAHSPCEQCGYSDAGPRE